MKVKQKGSQMEIDDALNALHLSNTKKKKRRRLSGTAKTFTQTIDESEESTDTTDLDPSVSQNPISPTSDTNEGEEPIVRRLTRKKSTPVRWDPQNVVTKKKTLDTNNVKDIEKYYLDKNVKKTSTSLETIFEEESAESSKKLMGSRKLRRFLQFDKITKGRIKKRKENAQKLSAKKKKSIKSTLSELHKKLSLLEGED